MIKNKRYKNITYKFLIKRRERFKRLIKRVILKSVTLTNL